MNDENVRSVAIINSVSEKSTGKICYGLLKYYVNKSVTARFCYGYGKRLNDPCTYRIDSYPERYLHALSARVTGYQGYYSVAATKRLLKYLDEMQINTIYGVGLHGYYLNERMMFEYIAHKKIDFVYVMTEEYPFYGKCGYANKCTNYLNGCGNCPYLKEYPKSWFFDRTAQIFQMKKKAYQKIKDHSIFVGPEYTIKAGRNSPLLDGIQTAVIDEAVDTDFYSPRDTKRLKAVLGIDDNKVVMLCVAPSAYGKKGTKYFTELAKRFEGDNRYVFVHVGYTGPKEGLPRNYIAIGYEADQDKLAYYYSVGDLFIFPSLLDTMPNACLEALSCGTPLLCFNTSGMPYLGDENVLTLVEAKNVGLLADVVNRTGKKTQEKSRLCREYAIKRYSNKDYYKKLEGVLDLL